MTAFLIRNLAHAASILFPCLDRANGIELRSLQLCLLTPGSCDTAALLLHSSDMHLNWWC